MINGVRAAVVLTILAYWPGLIEQFEHPKATMVRVIGISLLVAALTDLARRRGDFGRTKATRGRPFDVVRGRAGGAAQPRRPETPGAEHVVRWQLLDVCVTMWLLIEIVSACTSISITTSVWGDTDQHEGLITSLGLAGLYCAARMGTVGVQSARRTLSTTMGGIAVACGQLYCLANR